MGRPSNLTDAQWGEVLRLAAGGETITALAKRFKVSISAVSKKVSKRVEDVKTLANTIATSEQQFESLPLSEKVAVRNIADQLKAVAGNLTTGAKHSSATFAELSEMAHGKVAKVRKEDGSLDAGVLGEIAMLTATANRAAVPGLRLVVASPEKTSDVPTWEDMVTGGDRE